MTGVIKKTKGMQKIEVTSQEIMELKRKREREMELERQISRDINEGRREGWSGRKLPHFFDD